MKIELGFETSYRALRVAESYFKFIHHDETVFPRLISIETHGHNGYEVKITHNAPHGAPDKTTTIMVWDRLEPKSLHSTSARRTAYYASQKGETRSHRFDEDEGKWEEVNLPNMPR